MVGLSWRACPRVSVWPSMCCCFYCCRRRRKTRVSDDISVRLYYIFFSLRFAVMKIVECVYIWIHTYQGYKHHNTRSRKSKWKKRRKKIKWYELNRIKRRILKTMDEPRTNRGSVKCEMLWQAIPIDLSHSIYWWSFMSCDAMREFLCTLRWAENFGSLHCMRIDQMAHTSHMWAIRHCTGNVRKHRAFDGLFRHFSTCVCRLIRFCFSVFQQKQKPIRSLTWCHPLKIVGNSTTNNTTAISFEFYFYEWGTHAHKIIIKTNSFIRVSRWRRTIFNSKFIQSSCDTARRCKLQHRRLETLKFEMIIFNVHKFRLELNVRCIDLLLATMRLLHRTMILIQH